MKTNDLMMRLIASEFPYESETEIPKEISEETIKELYSLSQKQDIAHITGSALMRNGLLEHSGAKNAFNKQKLLTVYRREQLNAEEAKICDILEEADIDYIPLKGAVIRGYYPEEWMRTSCDIDILVRNNELERAIALIIEKLGYEDMGRDFHDHSLRSKNGVHLELHFSINENDKKLDSVLNRVWDHVIRPEDNKHRFLLSNEFLMFHIIAHTQYHFSAGGCGIRPFIDMWVLEHELDFSKEMLYELLRESGSEKFYEACRVLIEVWFKNGRHSRLTEMMESYILSGGAFGTVENRAYAKGGRIKYLFSRVFVSKKELKIYFPDVDKKPWLLPYYEAKRWTKLLGKKKMAGAGGKNSKEVADMIEELGL